MTELIRKLAVDAGSLELHLGDITKAKASAIVNAANAELAVGAGVCGAIHRAAGKALTTECRERFERDGPCPTGGAVITGAGRLPAQHVIHTVGPIWRGGHQEEARQLASCFRNCLRLAVNHRLDSIAFPAISTGIFGYPVKQAARVALVTTMQELGALQRPLQVWHVLFDREALQAYDEALSEIEPFSSMA